MNLDRRSSVLSNSLTCCYCCSTPLTTMTVPLSHRLSFVILNGSDGDSSDDNDKEEDEEEEEEDLIP